MAKTLVTGGNGFIGSAVVRQLAERGDELRLTQRRRSRLDNLEGVEYESAACDILDRAAVRRALRGVDRVYHCAGLISLLEEDDARVFDVNVRGTRIVLEECLRAGVERVVYTSGSAAIGPAPPGETADESQVFTAGSLGVPYINSKHEAEVEVFRLAAKGLPVVCVNPCQVLGTGDVYARSTRLVRRFLLGEIPAYAPGAVNVVDVHDVARGHLLAEERGNVADRYILGNRNYTLDRLFADLARISGHEAPAVRLSPSVALRVAQLVESATGNRAPVSSREVRVASQWWAFSSNKAKRELGWRPSPHEDALEATVGWYREREAGRIARRPNAQPLQYKAVATALGALGGAVRAGRSVWPLGRD